MRRTESSLDAGDEYGLVTGQYFGFVDIVLFNNAVSGVALLPDDKEDTLVIQGIKPRVVRIGAIHNDDAVYR